MCKNSIKLNDYPLIREIYEEYRLLRENGNSRDKTEELLKSGYQDELLAGVYDDALLFRIGLAEAQFRIKELSKDVAANALEALESVEKYCLFSQDDIDYCRVKYQQAPMLEKKVIRRKRYRCVWNVGDTFSVKLTSNAAIECGLYEKFAVLQKVNSIEFGDGSLLPLVRISIWDEINPPISPEAFYRKDPIRTKNMYGNPPKFQYSAQILITSKRQITPDVFKFVGNFPIIKNIPDEVIPQLAGEIVMLSPKHIDEECCWIYRNSLRKIADLRDPRVDFFEAIKNWDMKTGDGLTRNNAPI